MELYAIIAKLVEQGSPFVLATVTGTQGSTPQKPGSKMVVLPSGELVGTIGGGAVEQQIIDAAKQLLSDDAAETKTIETHLTHDLGMCCGGRMTVFLEKHGGQPKLWMFGAGHVAKEVAALAHAVGFAVTVVDEREEWLSAARFPHATLKREHPADAASAHAGALDTYFCVCTHDHPLDQACVEALLAKPFAWLGVIGSERKAHRFRMRLEAAGVPAEQLARMECPMGLPINALTPQEIAVSIVGRLVEVRRHTRAKKS